MNWVIWDQIETILDRFQIRPLVAIVPENRDPELEFGPAHSGFWDRARSWRDKGWTIAIHGYQHRYVTQKSGLLKLNRRSEFAGLGYSEQEAKLSRSLEIFAQQGLHPGVWIAPSHSFDINTIAALHKLGVCTISDGLSRWPHMGPNGMFWIPQQLWRFRSVPSGIWTVCYHHNGWTANHLDRFRRDIESYRPQITDVTRIHDSFSRRRRGFSDRLCAVVLRSMIINVARLPRREHFEPDAEPSSGR